MSISTWAEDDRPREKMILKGRNALSDAELIAILIGTGSSSKSAVDLGRELLALSNGDLNDFSKLRMAQLCTIKGIGESKAISIMAALELGRRRKEGSGEKRIRVSSSHQLYDLLKPYFEDLLHEEFYVVYLNRANLVIAVRQVSIGGTAATIVDPKVIFKIGIDLQASAIVLAHNHPSGTLKPSEDDDRMTKKIVQSANLLEMPVLDHLIITDNGYFSFADSERL